MYALNGDAISRQGPRIVDGAEAVCAALDHRSSANSRPADAAASGRRSAAAAARSSSAFGAESHHAATAQTSHSGRFAWHT